MNKNQQKHLKNITRKCEKALDTLNSSTAPENNIPQELLLNRNTPGVFFGSLDNSWKSQYVGMRQGIDGHILVVGGSGTGKSSGIAKQTLRTWNGSVFAIDVKGDLSNYYRCLYERGIVKRPYIIFDFNNVEGYAFDPFWWLLKDEKSNLFNNIREIALTLIPNNPEEKEPFWRDSEQALLSAALLHYFRLGLSFSECLCAITDIKVNELCAELAGSSDNLVKKILGEMGEMDPKTLCAIARGFRNKLLPFTTDEHVCHAFRGKSEEAKCFTFEDLKDHNIFFRVSEDTIAQRKAAINLLVCQLVHYFERRQEKYSPEGKNIVQTLLMLDEFPRLGKIEPLANAVSTLRSKGVNICLMAQSLAQFDKIYGKYERRVICDDCNYKAILGANDAETQLYFANLIGRHLYKQCTFSTQFDENLEVTGYSVQVSKARVWIVQPHELSSLQDVLLLSPYGFHRAKKCLSHNADDISQLSHVIIDETEKKTANVHKKAKMLTIDERTENAKKKIKEAMEKQRQAERQEREIQEARERQIQRNNYVIGNIVVPYLPTLTEFKLEDSIAHDNYFEILRETQSGDGMQKGCQTDCKSRKEYSQRIQRIAYHVGEIVTPYLSVITGFEPGLEVKSGDCLKILSAVLNELVKDSDILEELKRNTPVSDDQLTILDAVLTELIAFPKLNQIRKKATDIVMIENFFAEIKVEIESSSAEN